MVDQASSPAQGSERTRYSRNITLAVLAANVGCLTVFITLAAVFIGLWLDNVFGSKPWLTLALVGLSLPVSLLMMFFVVHWTTSKMSFEDVKKKFVMQEGNDLD